MFQKKIKGLNTIICINLFGLAVAVSFISNNTGISVIIKTTGAVLAILSFWWFCNRNQINCKLLSQKLFERKFSLFLISFVALPACSLFYSVNTAYGIFKLMNLLVSAIPLIILFAALLALYDEEIKKWIRISAQGWSVIIVLCLLILQPINIQGVYHFSITHWSHVMVGRILFCLYLVLLSFFIIQPTEKPNYFLGICLSLLGIGLVMSGLRTAILGMIGLTPVYLILGLFRKSLSLKRVILFSLLMVVVCLSTAQLQQKNSLHNRMNFLKEIETGKIKKEGSFKGRIQSFEICLERFKEHPIKGVGFGGFYTPYKNYKAWVLKYPHNIFLEYGVEMGIIGLIWLLITLLLLFKGTINNSPTTFLFFVGALWLSFFSKDIPSNSLLFLGVVCYFVKPGSYYLTEA